MIKLVILFRRPQEQPEQLITDVMGRLVPRCRGLPGLIRLEVAPTHGGLEMGKPDRRGPPFLMLELYFPDRETFDSALLSTEGHETMDELMDISGHEVNVFVAEVRPVSV